MITPYLIKSVLCLLFLVAFYKVALENTPLHKFKRFFLLASLVFSFTIPLVTITYTSDEIVLTEEIPANTTKEIASSAIPKITKPAEEPLFPIENVLWSIYITGAVFFGIRFARNLYQIRQKITTGYTLKKNHYALSLLPRAIVPHSFLSWIFLSRKSYEENTIPPEVIAHEAAHVRQLHSLDVIFVELLTVFFWFNPMVWITKSSVKLNHEFLADQEALKTASNSHTYQHLLLRHASGPHQTGLESPLNYSSLKKRILMLSHSFSRQKLIVRISFLIPIIALCVYLFNEKIVAQERTTIEGSWIESQQEHSELNIYKSRDTLWLEQNALVAPIIQNNDQKIVQIDNNTYLLEKTEDANLKIGNSIYKPKSESVKLSFVGSWKNPEREKVFSFSLQNGGLVCTIFNPRQNNWNTYYPKLDSDFIKLTFNNELYTFKRKGSSLIDQNGNPYYLNKEESLDQSSEKISSVYKDKLIKINIENETIYLDGEKVAFKKFVKKVDALTKNWSAADFENFSFHINTQNADRDFLNRLETEFEKTKLYKKSGRSMLPPPPAPPNTLKGTAYPPPPPPRNATVYRSDQMVSGDIQIDGKSYTVNENEDGEVSYYDENGKKLTGKEEKLIKGKVEALSAKRIELLRQSDSIRLQSQKIRKEADRIRAEADKIRAQSERVRAKSIKVKKEAEATREELMEQREEAREDAEAQREELKERKEVIMAQREARRAQMMAQREQQTATMTKRRQIIRERDDGVSFPLPPVPPEPLDLIVSMAKQNAVFFYDDKPIPSDKAIDLIKNNESLNIHVKEFAKSNPVVNLSTKAFKLED